MKYRRMGRTGLKLSEISLGSWITIGEQLEEAEAINLLQIAYHQGVNFFDTADEYAKGRAELILGKAIKGFSRESIVLSTKVWAPTMLGPNGRGLSRKHILESCNQSLRRLGTDYIDIYFCHSFDEETSVEETVRSMDDLVHQGKVLYWGTSNWDILQFVRAHSYSAQSGLYGPVVEQPEYNMLYRHKVEQELLKFIPDLGFGLVTYSPLHNGLLSGKYNDGVPKGTRLEHRKWLHEILLDPEKIVRVRELSIISDDLGISLAQLAIAWILRFPQISSVITGASKKEQLEENLDAGQVIDKLSPDILNRIENVLSK
jgi:voltage-dependent potassium channel beta subunit